jgi:hypothetical protein
VAAKTIRFPPGEDDVYALQVFWRHRLDQLRDTGLEALQSQRAFEHAAACKPYAFAYAGKGKMCRRPFCPFCTAADSAAAFERAHRVVQRHGGDIGFVVNQVTARVPVEDLPDDPIGLLYETGSIMIDPTRFEDLLKRALGSLARYSFWPHDKMPEKAVLAARCLAAVPRERADRVYAARRKYREAVRRAQQPERELARELGVPYAPRQLSPRKLGLDRQNLQTLDSGDYGVRSSSLSLARAVAHVYKYPAALLTAPAEEVVAILNRLARQRLSAVRGLFRTSLPLNPRGFKGPFVPTRPDGAGIASFVAALLPEADEGLAAREFARALQLPAAGTFVEASRALGFPVHWLGRVDLPIAALVRPSKKSELYRAVAEHCPRRPGEDHALVCLVPGVGLMVLSTIKVAPTDLGEEVGVLGVQVRRQRYTLLTADSYARSLERARHG